MASETSLKIFGGIKITAAVLLFVALLDIVAAKNIVCDVCSGDEFTCRPIKKSSVVHSIQDHSGASLLEAMEDWNLSENECVQTSFSNIELTTENNEHTLSLTNETCMCSKNDSAEHKCPLKTEVCRDGGNLLEINQVACGDLGSSYLWFGSFDECERNCLEASTCKSFSYNPWYFGFCRLCSLDKPAYTWTILGPEFGVVRPEELATKESSHICECDEDTEYADNCGGDVQTDEPLICRGGVMQTKPTVTELVYNKIACGDLGSHWTNSVSRCQQLCIEQSSCTTFSYNWWFVGRCHLCSKDEPYLSWLGPKWGKLNVSATLVSESQVLSTTPTDAAAICGDVKGCDGLDVPCGYNFQPNTQIDGTNYQKFDKISDATALAAQCNIDGSNCRGFDTDGWLFESDGDVSHIDDACRGIYVKNYSKEKVIELTASAEDCEAIQANECGVLIPCGYEYIPDTRSKGTYKLHNYNINVNYQELEEECSGSEECDGYTTDGALVNESMGARVNAGENPCVGLFFKLRAKEVVTEESAST